MYILATQDVTLILLLQPYQQNVHYRNTQHSLKVSEYLLEQNKKNKARQLNLLLTKILSIINNILLIHQKIH